MNTENMSLREKVLQTFVVTIREVNRHGGPKEFFKKYPVGGLFFCKTDDPNRDDMVETGIVSSPKRIRECREASPNPLLICADWIRLPGQTHQVTDRLRPLGGTGREQDAYNYGKMVGMQMNAYDVDWALQPIVDLYYNRAMPFPTMCDDPMLTAKLCRQIVRGVQDQGVCATVKHFPGLGTANINMHFAPGRNVLDFDEWMKSYGHIYGQMIEENVCSVMTTHVTLRSFDNEGDRGYYPIATFSPKLTMELLKGKLGFEGAVVTDALVMGGMATGNLVEECVQAFRSGADLLLWPPVETADRIVELLESGEIPMSRLEDALARIEKMRSFRETAKKENAMDTPDCDFINQTSQQIIRDAVCLLRNERNLIPLAENVKKLLIVDVTDGDDSALRLKAQLEKSGYAVDVERDIYDVVSNVSWQEEIDALQDQYDRIIFNVNTILGSVWSQPYMLIWASHLFDKNKKIIVNHGSPYFAPDYFPEDPTFIQSNAEVSDASIQAIADGITGKMDFKGHSVIRM